MQAWYQFGYDGFPAGDARRRFYCQRDDPCDSEEELEGYDGNDRPVYYYPMRDSEEASDSSALLAGEGDDGLHGRPPTSPFPINVTVCNEVVGRCGTTTVLLKAVYDEGNTMEEAYFFIHGGAMAVTGRVTNTSDVFRVRTCAARGVGSEAVTPVSVDASLADIILSIEHNSSVLPGLLTNTNVAPVPPLRFGHCTAGIQVPFGIEALCSGYRDKFELHLTLVVGGAFVERVPKSFHDLLARDTVLCEPWLCVTILRCFQDPVIDPEFGGKSQSFLTEGYEVVPAQYTLHVPLAGMTGLSAIPRLFATLTPWPGAPEDPSIASYAYLGGSINGWDPVPLFGLWLLHVDTLDWSVSVSLLETLGEEPAARFGHSATLVNEQEIYVFGGVGAHMTYLNDLMVFNCVTKVWREVYTPCRFSTPPRAFHSSILLSATCSLIIVGGEAAGRHERSVWSFNVRRGNWCLLTFPLLERALCAPYRASNTYQTSWAAPAIRLLCERESLSVRGRSSADDVRHLHLRRFISSSVDRANIFGTPQPTAPVVDVGDQTAHFSVPLVQGDGPDTPLSLYYFAALHGSQPQVVSLRHGVMVIGGTKSPGVAPLSWIPARNYSLRECAALWVCTHRNGLLEKVRDRLRSVCGGSDHCGALNYGKNTFDGCHTLLVERSLGEEQLDKWQREARKRLRD